MELLLRIGRLIQCRRRVRFSILPLIWTMTLLLTAVQSWWALFGLRAYTNWSFVTFLAVLLHPLVFFVAASLVLPDREEFAHNDVDLEQHYYGNFRWFFGAILLTIAASLIRPIILYSRFDLNLDIFIQGFLFVLAAIAMMTPAKPYHRLAAVAFPLTLVGYVFLLFMHL
ncbi:MAG: hypothetical protein ACXU8U_07535 [Asticcacaulis sp.]